MGNLSIEDLIQMDLGLKDKAVNALAETADKKYRKIHLGKRIIHIPLSELKLVQCWISDFLRAEAPVIENHVTAYETGCSIVKNADIHKDNTHILTLDIHHFFHSCTASMVEDVFSKTKVYDPGKHQKRMLTDSEISLLSKLSCYKEALCIGAPSSPALANRIMLPVDAEITKCLGGKFAFSRYSDDITISSEEWIDAAEVIGSVEAILNRSGFELNHRKSKCRGKRNQRRVTGVFIQPNGKLSIGAKRKREIKHELYEYLTRQEGNPAHALGLIYFAIQVEPSWAARVISKYASCGIAHGVGVIRALREATA